MSGENYAGAAERDDQNNKDNSTQNAGRLVKLSAPDFILYFYFIDTVHACPPRLRAPDRIDL